MTIKNLFILLCILPLIGCFGPSAEEKAFNDLRESISVSSEEFAKKNSETKDEILEMIAEEEGRPGSKELLGVINFVDSVEQEMMGFLDSIVTRLEEIGEMDASGFIQNKADIEKGQAYFLGDDPLANGGQGSGIGSELSAKLNDFTETCNQVRIKHTNNLEKFISPTQLSSDDEVTWEYATFHSKPLIAHLAMMEKLKLDISEMSRELFTELKNHL